MPPRVLEQVAEQGAVATSKKSIGPLAYIETYSVLPGPGHRSWSGTRTLECFAQNAAFELSWIESDVPTETATQACRHGASTLSYMADVTGITREAISPRMRLAPGGWGFEVRDLSLIAWRPIRPLYAKGYRESSMRLDIERAVTITLAHEFVHLAIDLAGSSIKKTDEERLAHTAGYCAAWNVLGGIDPTWLAIGRVQDSSSLPDGVLASNSAGIDVAAHISDLLEGVEGSDESQRVSQYCEGELRALWNSMGNPATSSGHPKQGSTIVDRPEFRRR